MFEFKSITNDTPRNEWLLLRWKNSMTGQWMLPVVAQIKGWNPYGDQSCWDGIRTYYTEATHWCPIPPVAGET